jgi:large subunit ribosomal protein L20
MPRAKRGFKARRRRKGFIKAASGFRGRRHNCYRAAREAVHHAWKYAYAHRRAKKGDFRKLWIARINAASRTLGVSYSRLISALTKSNVEIDRKILADLAVSDPKAFAKIVEFAKAA